MIRLHTVLFPALFSAAILSACGETNSEPAAADHQAMQHQAAASKKPAAEAPAAMDHASMDHTSMGKGASQTLKYRCADDPDTLRDRPGKCADGSFAAAAVDADTSVEYYCPMDAGQESLEPGKCSGCGMFLSARVKDGGDDAHKGHNH